MVCCSDILVIDNVIGWRYGLDDNILVMDNVIGWRYDLDDNILVMDNVIGWRYDLDDNILVMDNVIGWRYGLDDNLCIVDAVSFSSAAQCMLSTILQDKGKEDECFVLCKNMTIVFCHSAKNNCCKLFFGRYSGCGYT